MNCSLSQDSFRAGWLLRPVALVGAPEADVAVAEEVPPSVKHLSVEAEDAVASYACWGRGECSETVAYTRTICFVNTREQVPESESVVLARVGKDRAKQGAAFRGRVCAKIKSRQCVTKCGCGVFEVWGARTDFRARSADRPGRDEGFVADQLEADPAHRRAQEARS